MATAAPTPPSPLPSEPRYGLARRADAAEHLLVAQSAAAEQAAASELAGLPLSRLAVAQGSAAALQRALLERLRHSPVGLRLYLAGDEAFVWPLYALARNAGLQADEIDLLRSGEARRPVYCVHCATTQLGDASERLQCRQCGVGLEVRRHFSRRLGAYLGVCADADHPYAVQANPEAQA